jgi:hypothetical protein
MTDLETLTLGELDELPPDRQKQIWLALDNYWFARMEARDNRYLQGDYDRHLDWGN